MYFYIEDFILLNFVSDLLVIMPVCKKNCIKHKMAHSVIVSTFETGLAFILFSNSYLFKNMFFKLLTLFFSALFITRPFDLKNYFKNLFLFYIYTFVLAGSVLFVKFILIVNPFTEIYYSFLLSDIIIGFGIGRLLILLLETFVFNKVTEVCGVYDAELYIDDKRYVKLYLFADTGNLLKTMNGDSIVIINQKIMKELCMTDRYSFDSYDEYLECYENLHNDIFRKIGITKVSTVSGSKYLLTLKIDKIIFSGEWSVDSITLAGAELYNSEFDGIFNPVILHK